MPTGSKVLEYNVLPGDRLDQVTVGMVNLAREKNLHVTCKFNDTMLLANPGDNAAQVAEPYTLKLKAGEVEAARRAALERKLREEKLKAALAAGLVLEKRPPNGFEFRPGGEWTASLRLITPEQLRSLPAGTVLKSVNGSERIVGVDDLDDETRGGFTAWGFEL